MNLGPLRRMLKRGFRRKRMQRFERTFHLRADTLVLDIGGTPYNWSFVKNRPRVVLLNNSYDRLTSGRPDPAHREPGVWWVLADARRLPFRTDSFDVAFSNSVIEHVGARGGQKSFADECRRVGRRYFVQTPNRRFPLETHLLTPFVHWLPRSLELRLLRNFTVWGVLTRPSPDRCRDFMDDVWLLDRHQMAQLFPDGRINGDRLLGVGKALIAVGPT
jgi:methyltransferase family protein